MITAIPGIIASNAGDADANVFFAACASAGTPVTNTTPYYWQNRYVNMIRALKASGQWSIIDSLQVYATNQEVWAKIDIKNPARSCTITNTYGGEWGFTGFVGNGNAGKFALSTGFNPGDGGTYNYLRNDACIGYFSNTDAADANTAGHYYSAFDSGAYSFGSFENTVQAPKRFINASSYLTDTISAFNSRVGRFGWHATSRNNSANNDVYEQGINGALQTSPSHTMPSSPITLFSAYPLINGFYVSATLSAFYAGSSAVNHNTIGGIINGIFWNGAGVGAPYRVLFKGDSMTGDPSNNSQSVTNTYPIAVISGLTNAAGYAGAIVATSGQTVANMLANIGTELNPYPGTYLIKDIVVVWGGTNDIAADAGTAAQLYADLQSYGAAIKAAGYKKVILMGIVDRNAFPGTVTHATFNTRRASVRTSLLADFNVSTAVTNFYKPAGGITYFDGYIDLYADTNLQDATNLTYFQGDQIHLTATGYGLVANTYCKPSLLLL